MRQRYEKRYARIPDQVRRTVLRLAAAGVPRAEILQALDVSVGTFLNITVPLGGVIRHELWQEPSGNRLSANDRVEIRLGIERGETFTAIAKTVNRHKSTVCREVNANGRRSGYKPLAAHKAAWQRARRAKPTKLASHPALLHEVEQGLRKLWSPVQIAATLRQTYGQDRSMTVSHETIYKSLYVQGRGELRRELTRCLRTGRAKRRPQGRAPRGAAIVGMVNISERPAEVEDRAVPGHWEGDLIIGEDGASAVGTLVERTTRFVLLLHLPDGRSAESVREAMTAKIATLPAAVTRSLTWDQGVEMAEHAQFTIDAGIPVFFCDPHSPWQRGTNENTNGLLRQYMPKGTDLSVHTEAALDAFADSLNGRPRQTLGWGTPAQTLARIVATTA